MTRTEISHSITLIEQQLRRGQRHFTLSEAAAITGLSIDACRDALAALLHKYTCRLQVGEYGDLIYNFGDTLRRRGSKTFAEHVETMMQWLWKAFTVFYKAWIAVTLVVYFVLFLIIIGLVLVAYSSGSGRSSERRRSPAPSLGGSRLLEMFWAIFQWRTITGTLNYPAGRYGYGQERGRYGQEHPGAARAAGSKKNFIAAVYDFVFGPPRLEREALAHEREVAAYTRQHQGLLVAADLIALAGWVFAQAETFLTDCLIRFQGEIKVSDNGVLYGQFDDLLRGVGRVESTPIVYYWDEDEPPYVLTGNSSGYNLAIALMNGFNLLLALVVLSGSFTALLTRTYDWTFGSVILHHQGLFYFVLGWLPVVFSVLFFLIPLLRWFKVRALERRRQTETIRKRLLKGIFARQGQPQTVGDIVRAVNTETPAVSPPVVEPMMRELALDLAGDMLVNETAQIQFTFPRISRELQDVQHLRQQRHPDASVGDIIADSQ